MPTRHPLATATIERVRAAFPMQAPAALATLARVAAGDDDAIHERILDVAAGDLIALKRATWLAVRDWRDLMLAASFVRDDVPAAPAPPPPAGSAALMVAAQVLGWAETVASDPAGGEIFVEHSDRAVVLTTERFGEPYRSVYLGLDATPEEETFSDIARMIDAAGRWLREGGHRDFDEIG